MRVRSSFVSARGVVRSEARLEVLTTSGSSQSRARAPLFRGFFSDGAILGKENGVNEEEAICGGLLTKVPPKTRAGDGGKKSARALRHVYVSFHRRAS